MIPGLPGVESAVGWYCGRDGTYKCVTHGERNIPKQGMTTSSGIHATNVPPRNRLRRLSRNKPQRIHTWRGRLSKSRLSPRCCGSSHLASRIKAFASRVIFRIGWSRVRVSGDHLPRLLEDAVGRFLAMCCPLPAAQPELAF